MPQIVEVPGIGQVEFPDGMTDEQIVSAIKANEPAKQKPPSTARPAPIQRAPKPAGNVFNALLEPVGVLGSSAIAAPVSGIAGIGSAVGNLLGIESNPASVIERVGSALTYEPRTKAGDVATSGVTYPFRKLAEGADYVGGKVAEASGSPALGAAANVGIQALPAALLRTKTPTPAAQTQPLVGTAAVAEKAMQAGFKLTPDQAGGGGVSRSAASMTGRAQLERELSKDNAGRVNALAQEEIGLPPKPVIDRAAIKQKRDQANSVYAEASKLPAGKYDAQFKADVTGVGNRTGSASFPGDTNLAVENLKQYYSSLNDFRPADIVAKVRQLRADGHKNQGKIRSPEENAKGYAQVQIANALEGMLERHAVTLGKPDLVTRFKEARTQLAKINTIERSIRGANVSARTIHSAKTRGEPLSGNLKTIAESYESFDRVFQDVGKIRDHGPFSVVDYMLGAGGMVANPALAAAVLSRPAVRAGLRSGPYQSALKPKPGFPYSPNAFLRDAEFQALLSQQAGQ